MRKSKISRYTSLLSTNVTLALRIATTSKLHSKDLSIGAYYASSYIGLLFTTNSKWLSDESSKQFIINAIVILLMYHLISIYRFLHLTSGQFGNTKTQIQCVYSVQFHWWIEMTSLVTKRQMKKLKVSTTSYKICSKIFFLTRFPKPTIITGWILRLFYPWEIGLNWRRDITLIQLNRIKIFSPLNQTSAQTWSLRPNNGAQIN